MKRILHVSAKALRTVLIVLLLLIVAVAIFLNSNYFDTFIQNQIQTRLSKALHREVTVESVAFNPFKLDFLLKNFRIGNDPRSPEVPFFVAQEIYARVSWRHVLRGKARIREVRLYKPELHVIFYKEGGNNWPSTKRKQPSEKKKGGLDLIISKVDCDNMMIVYNNQRLPVSFSVSELETYVEYDTSQENYFATTSFKDGFLRITHFEFWKFDLDATYRIIGSRVSFQRLMLLSSRTKFYMAGEMYNLKDPFFDFRFRSHISLTQTKEVFRFGPEMSGGGSFKAVYRGTFGKFRMQGTGSFRDFIFYSIPIDTAKFDLDMTDNWLNVTNIRAEMFGGDYKGVFSIAPLKGHSIFKTKGDFRSWDGRKLGRFVRMNDMLIPIKGSGSASMRWEEGGFKDLIGNFRFKMEPYERVPFDLAVEAEKSAFDNALFVNPYVVPVLNETEFHIERRQLRDIESSVQTPYTKAHIRGTIDFSGKADLDIVSHSEKIPEIDLLFHYLQAYFKGKPADVQEFWAVRGSADFNGKLDETVWSPFRPRLTGRINAKNVLYHGVPWDDVRADVMFHDRLIQVYDSDLTLGKAKGRAQAKFFLEDKESGTPDVMDVTGSVTNFPAQGIVHAFLMELPIYGTVNASIILKGPFEELEGRSDFEAFHGSLWDEEWDRGAGTVLFFPDSLGLRDVTAYVQDGYARVSGDLVYESDDYNLSLVAENIPVEELMVLKNNSIRMSGLARVNGSGFGTLLKPHLEGEIAVQNLVYNAEPYGDVISRIALHPGSLSVDTTGIARGIPSSVKARMDLDGKFPFQADFDIEKFPIEILTRAYAPGTSQLTGLAGGTFQMMGTMNPPDVKHISGALDFLQLKIPGLTLNQARPVNVLLSDDVIYIKDTLLVGDYTSLSLTGKIFPKQEGRLDLEFSADMGLEVLSNWDKNITASGTSKTRISIGGTFQQPSLTGVLEIQNGFFRHYSFPNSLTDISALFTFKNKNISLQSLRATSSGGTLTAGGSATLKGYDLDHYRFDLYAEKIRVHFPEGLRTTVSGELHLQAERDSSYLVGDIEVLQGIYTRSFEETPDIFGYARVPTFAGLGTAPAMGQELKLNLRIHSDGNLLVKNNFANVESSANLILIGTMNDPVLVGRLEVKKGTVTFRDRDYKVSRGALDFQNPYRTDATLNFIAETRVREYQITLNFNGTFDRIYHDLSSDPPLPKDEIYVLLGVGSTREDIRNVADVSALIAGQTISQFVTSPITSPLERGFKKVLGLQKFQIDPIFVHSTQVATARVTLEKDISSDFSVTYSTNVFTAAEEIILLQYQLTDEIHVTASKDERARYGIDVLVTKSFE